MENKRRLIDFRLIDQTLKPPEYVLWYLDAKPLNFGSEHGRSNSGGILGGAAGAGTGASGLSSSLSSSSSSSSSNSVNTGHTVSFEPGPPSVSRLSVHSATAANSGRYTCQPSSGLSASTDVHVALGKWPTTLSIRLQSSTKRCTKVSISISWNQVTTYSVPIIIAKCSHKILVPYSMKLTAPKVSFKMIITTLELSTFSQTNNTKS